jgi:type III secretory pathway component EscV
MAMSGDGMGSEIAAALEAATGGTIVGTESEDYWKAIADAIVKHIIANATVATPDTKVGTVTS